VDWVLANSELLWRLALDHVALSAPPIVLGFALSLPIGWAANRYRFSRGALLSIAGILYAIPSLPLFFVMPLILGTRILDPANVVVALTIYAVALMVRTVADGLAATPGEVRRSATALGFSAWRRFWQVDLPLAGPVLLAGLRVVSVSTVSLVTVGAVIGVNSLGYLFLDGYYRFFPLEVAIGIVLTLVVALVFDGILVLAGRLLMPWARTSRAPGRRALATREAAAR